MGFSLKVCGSDNHDIWNGFVERANQMFTIAHNPSLGEILKRTYGYQSENYLIYDGDSLVGVLPVCRIGGTLVSMPHFSYGGVLSSLDYSSRSIRSDVITDNFSNYEVRCFDRISKFCNTEKLTSFLELQPSVEDQMGYFKSKLRSQIRKGSKNNLEIRIGSFELLDDFYDVYSKNMHRLGSPAQGKLFFSNILNYYKYGTTNILCVYHDSKPIGVSFVLSYMGFSEVCWAATVREYNYLQTNTFLYWEMIKLAIGIGNRVFSFGRSTVGSSSHRFKKQWGTKEQKLYFNYSNYSGIDIKKMQILQKIWRASPFPLVDLLGPLISKRIY